MGEFPEESGKIVKPLAQTASFIDCNHLQEDFDSAALRLIDDIMSIDERFFTDLKV